RRGLRWRRPRIHGVRSSRRSDRPSRRCRRNHGATTGLNAWELLEESQVVLVEQTDVLHAVAEDGDALDTDSPREAGVLFRVVADGLEHRRVHHAAAAKLDPAGLLAHRAARAVTLPAAEIDLGARLGVGEEARTEAHARFLGEHLLR